MSGEFRGDFTRNSFDPQKNFLRVLMQQGKVQVDADWNEQVAILLHYLQTLARDLIGSHGGPVERSGFKITFDTQEDVKNSTILDFQISTGNYYVNGILCQNYKIDENGYELPYIRYYQQPNYPFNQDELPDLPFLVFLDVWERHITYIEDEEIREVALGGADTATRSQVIWQVKVEKLDEVTSCADIKWNDFLEKWQPKNRGLLAAKAKETTEQTEACLIKPDARYRGKENQLYRVEIHAGGTEKPTFKWSRENSSVIFPIDVDSNITITDTKTTVKLKHWWRNKRFCLAVGDWVEIVDDYSVLNQVVEPLWKVEKIEPGDFLVTLASSDSSRSTSLDIRKHPLLRRWEQKEKSGLKLINGAIPIDEATTDWFTLEDGVQIKFKQSELGENYRTGDYWLIPARTATGDVEWRKSADGKTPLALPPHGVEHHYAPLAVIVSAKEVPEDCRRQFYSLARSYYYSGLTRGIGSDLIWTDANVQ
ncbi:hypothetical protein NIES4071_36710 [Calothrix sp. NIES-4071]|nr:hypothetical protein NIES4071_36710 [Calothrix sp. NIES-4071]BAZ57990.1 hypothetical protein NIES4105_36640 [Calothrix sp. NIES-4105]